ncbi:MAG: hypothetical protein KDA88_00215 [Planctomycetaceae bacterium]|nr:hypothetical protein [Planctomycetaceae bacterium]MCB9950278.1 hypothetical protein [Planctomycetaceae bacterium]
MSVRQIVTALAIRWFVILLLTTGWVCRVTASDPIRSNAARGEEDLIQQLGAPSFQDRFAAEKELLERGLTSVSAVREALNNENAEIRYRAQRLMREFLLIEAETNEPLLLNSPWQLTEDVYNVWERWHATVGDSPASRQLLVQMLRIEPELLLALNAPQGTIRGLLESRCGELRMFPNQANQEANPLTTASVLFVTLQEDVQPSAQAMHVVSSLIATGKFMALLNDPQVGVAARTLVEQWIGHGTISTAYMRLQTSERMKSPAGMDAARELLSSQNAPGPTEQVAVRYLAKAGGNEAISVLESKLDDTTVIRSADNKNEDGTTESVYRVEFRDTVLLALVQMTKQAPTDYGFRQTDNGAYNQQNSGFESDLKREAALHKWQRWSRENLREVHAEPFDASEGTAL